MNPLIQNQLTLSDMVAEVEHRRCYSVDSPFENWTAVCASADTPAVFRNIMNGTKGKFIFNVNTLQFELPQDATAFKLLQNGLW